MSSDPVAASLGIVAYLALFFGAGLLFVFANLLIGRFVRPNDPHEEKLEIYECGEPAIGSSFVQFDLRFYVVALLFIIFDVEVAFFFPWATVFGKTTNMADPEFPVVVATEQGEQLTPAATALYRELGVRGEVAPPSQTPASLGSQQLSSGEVVKQGSRQLALISILDISVFFAVLMVGFFYVWKRGDLDWVRAVQSERSSRAERVPPAESSETVLSA